MIKNNLKGVFQFKFYRQIITINVLVITITIFVISSILFSLFSYNASKEISNTSTEMLTQVSYATEIVYNQVINICNQLISNSDINNFLYSKEDMKINNYKVSLLLRQIQSIYPFIKSIGLCNIDNNIAYDSRGVYIEKNVFKENTSKYMHYYPRIIENDLNLITFMLFPDFNISKSSSVAIVVNIDEQHLLQTIRDINSSHELNTFVIDSDGIILSHTSSQLFMQDYSNQNYIQKILNAGKDQGSFTYKINGEKQLVTYVKSELNWYVISIKPYSQLFSNVYQVRNITLIIVLLLTIFGLIPSLIVSKVLYNPMKSLVEKFVPQSEISKNVRFDEYSFLSNACSRYSSNLNNKYSEYQTSQLFKDNFIINLIKGNVTNILSDQDGFINSINQIKGPYYCTLLLKIDNFHSFNERIDKKDQCLLRFAICNVANEMLGKHCTNDAVILEEDEIVVLIQLENKRLPDNILLTLTEIQDALKSMFKFTISISIGDIVSTKKQIYDSYKSSESLIKYRFFYGHESILTSDRVRKHTDKLDTYPYEVEKKLIDSLDLCDNNDISKYIKEFMNVISTVSYYEAINNTYQLMLSLHKYFNWAMDIENNINKDYCDIMGYFLYTETLDDINVKITQFCSQICYLIEDKNNKLNAQKYNKIIDAVKNYVQENYYDPTLSIEMVSDNVGLSSGYLGKLFKNIANISFSDYLNNIRLEKAKELLVANNDPLYIVSEKVGILNNTYFSTLFKKTYGITPSQYRKNATIDR